MCYPIPCSCGKTTWAGCGEHIDAVRCTIPDEQWCSGECSDQGDPSSDPSSEPMA